MAVHELQIALRLASCWENIYNCRHPNLSSTLSTESGVLHRSVVAENGHASQHSIVAGLHSNDPLSENVQATLL